MSNLQARIICHLNGREQTVQLKNILEQTAQYPPHTLTVQKNQEIIHIFLVFQARKK